MRILICAILGAAAAGAAFAAPAPKAPHTSMAKSLTPQQIVAARQAAFGLSAGAFGGMKAVVEGGGEVKPLTNGARNLLRWARVLPAMFPQGSATPESHAKATVWQNRADFDQKAAAYSAAAEKLLAAAQANDKAAFATAWKATGQSCGACHEVYRVEEHH